MAALVGLRRVKWFTRFLCCQVLNFSLFLSAASLPKPFQEPRRVPVFPHPYHPI